MIIICLLYRWPNIFKFGEFPLVALSQELDENFDTSNVCMVNMKLQQAAA